MSVVIWFSTTMVGLLELPCRTATLLFMTVRFSTTPPELVLPEICTLAAFWTVRSFAAKPNMLLIEIRADAL